ncbi:MAG: ABC transporter permease subunit [Lachnospiraceae bacterium]|nr:ABC transporter permease subunit [Lachnospiraceae bacterium]
MSENNTTKFRSRRKAQNTADIVTYILLSILGFMWVFPFIIIILISFREEQGMDLSYIIPRTFSVQNYIDLFTKPIVSNTTFGVWFKNTLLISIVVTIISTFFVLSVSFTMSRIRFKMRRTFMNIALILGMFPGFMSMSAIYIILDAFGMLGKLTSLMICYSASAGLGFYVAKGFFDTIPKAMDEAAWIDGATKWTVFTKITMPLSKPIIVYTVLTSFMGPWMDYIFVAYVMGTHSDKYTVARGLYMMIDREHAQKMYTQFCAGAVVVSIPLAAVFLSMQKCYTEGLSGSVKG